MMSEGLKQTLFAGDFSWERLNLGLFFCLLFLFTVIMAAGYVA